MAMLIITVLAVLAVLAVVAGLVTFLVVRRRRPAEAAGAPTAPAWSPPPPTGVAAFRRPAEDEVVARLAVAVPDPDAASAQRIAQELADHAFATSDAVERVVVEDAEGQHVVTIPRRPPPRGPAPTRPDRAVAEGHPPGHVRSREPLAATPRLDADTTVPARSLADRLQLPDVVRAEVRRPDDVIDVVRATLVAGGHEVSVSGTTLVTGDTAVVVIPDDQEGADPLSAAYLRFQRSGARSGIIIHTGHVDPAELRRRDSISTHLRYAGRAAVPRMAAAVDLGLDPLAAARGVAAES